MSYLLACVMLYNAYKTAYIILKLISVSRETSTITTRRSMLPFASWKIRKDRNKYGEPSSNFSYFPLVIRIQRLLKEILHFLQARFILMLCFCIFFIQYNFLNISHIQCMYILLYYRRKISLRSFREIEKHVIPN